MKSAVCLIVRNERDAIKEWVAYYLALEFNTVLIFDHESNDGSKEVIDSFTQRFDVRRFDFHIDAPHSQTRCYANVCLTYSAEFDWIAFFDVDEFLVPPQGETITELLNHCDIDTSGIAIPWLFFGSSGHIEKPSGFIIQNYTRRAERDFPPNLLIKSVVRPSTVSLALNAHSFHFKSGVYKDSEQNIVDWQTPGRANMPISFKWRLHHYFTRSKAHWIERLERGQLGTLTRTMNDFQSYDRNEIIDPSAIKILPKLKKVLSQVELSSEKCK